MLIDAVVFDIDGVLADNSHRMHHITGPKRDWDAYYAGIPDDKPIPGIIQTLKGLRLRGEHIIFVTGRPEEHREATSAWLARHAYSRVSVHNLFMRPTGVYLPNDVMKNNIALGLKMEFNIRMVFEDDPRSIEMWKRHADVVLGVYGKVHYTG